MASKKKSAAPRVDAKKKSKKKDDAKAKKTGAKVKSKKVDPIPKGLHSVTPSLVFKNANAAIKFYREAFGAKELFRLTEAGSKIGHAEIKIGNSTIMVGEEYPDMQIYSAQHYQGSPVRMHIAVENVDKVFKKALAAGGKEARPLRNEFYGWRTGIILDPFGYYWSLGTQVEELSPKKMQKRFDKMMAEMAPTDPAQDTDGA